MQNCEERKMGNENADGHGDRNGEWGCEGVINGTPSWLRRSLSDLDDQMKILASSIQEGNSDTFGDRAEHYYRNRPQLFNLLQNLYNCYLSLADRYCQSLIQLKQHSHQVLPPSDMAAQSEINDNGRYDQGPYLQSESDAESIISYQQTPLETEIDNICAQLVFKTMDCEMLLHELGIQEADNSDSTRKRELQRSLLNVLESERLILLSENARLGCQMTTLVEHNKGLASESILMRRKASELARCLLKMREDHRVCMLSRKIEDLQGQINGLERRNQEYFEQLTKKEEDEKMKRNRAMAMEMCYEVEKMQMENRRLMLKNEETRADKVENVKMYDEKVGFNEDETMADNANKDAAPRSKWWNKVRKLDVFLSCGRRIK